MPQSDSEGLTLAKLPSTVKPSLKAPMPTNDAAVNKRTVTVSEFAVIVGISRSLAYQLVAENRVRSIRINRRIVIPLSAVESFLG